ncbi:hypothetical protein FQR65_LT04681 [Abscondita terminalis]|nr:hypothetical protein FQR65_LT04681 [Abscondita terminalis]
MDETNGTSNEECNPHKNLWKNSKLKMIKNIGTIINNIKLKHNLLAELTAYKNPRSILSTYKPHTFIRNYKKRKNCFTLCILYPRDRQHVFTDLEGSGEAVVETLIHYVDYTQY